MISKAAITGTGLCKTVNIEEIWEHNMGNHRTETGINKSAWPHMTRAFLHISFFLNPSEPWTVWLFSSGAEVVACTRLNDTICTTTDVSKGQRGILGNFLDLTQAVPQTYFKVFVCTMKVLDTNWRQLTSWSWLSEYQQWLEPEVDLLKVLWFNEFEYLVVRGITR